MLFSLEESHRSPNSFIQVFFTPYSIQQYLSSAFETKPFESFVKIMGVSLPLVTTDVHVLSCQEGKKSSCFLVMKVAWL